LPFFFLFKFLCLAAFRTYWIAWRYVGISDLVNIFLALFIAELVLVFFSLPMAVLPTLPISGLSKRLFFVDGLVSFFLLAALRISKRVYVEIIHGKRLSRKGKNTIIVGAGNVGEMMLRDMQRLNYENFYPLGFLDDDPMKIGTRIHGVSVLGSTDSLAEMIKRHSAEAVIIAITTLSHKTLKNLFNQAKNARVETIKIVPRIYDFGSPDINLMTLEDISIEDLIGRQSVQVDYQAIGAFIMGKSVLVTGAGGSIGSEIVAQVCAFGPGQMVLLDADETELHYMQLKLRRQFPHIMEKAAFVAGDIRDEVRVREVFETYRPQVIFHAAAYKHVPMMEYNPKEAVKVNILGTHTLACMAADYRSEKFIMISTDKAVRPTSVMGATKRVAEYVCKAYNHYNHNGEQGKRINDEREKGQGTRFISVRFGNVLGSRGSVLPLFLEQLRRGGPLTVTHKDMKRYFMTIPEAVLLVLQASMMGKGGEVFVLDMGEPVKIVDIAEELIRLHGMEPYRDIDIKFTGCRPGENLYEEILTAEEGTDASIHEKIFVSRNGNGYSLERVREMLTDFKTLVNEPRMENNGKVRDLLRKYVKVYEG
jgi:FlaA1/EpsC-like NDP-sugar epimerase